MLKRHIGTIGRQVLFKLSFMAGLGADLRKTTRDLMAMMVVLSKELNGIKTLLSRVERPIGEEHFILEDFTGRAFPIHLKTVGSWDTFEYILTDRFKGKKGAHRVRRKRYSLQEKASGQPVDRSVDRENAFLPYQRINMSMMCQDAQGTVDRTLASCPWCQALSPEDSCTETQWYATPFHFHANLCKDILNNCCVVAIATCSFGESSRMRMSIPRRMKLCILNPSVQKATASASENHPLSGRQISKGMTMNRGLLPQYYHSDRRRRNRRRESQFKISTLIQMTKISGVLCV